MWWMICYGCNKSKNIPCIMMIPKNNDIGMQSADWFYKEQLKSMVRYKCPVDNSANFKPVTFQQVIEIIMNAQSLAKLEFTTTETHAKLIENINDRFKNLEVV